MNNTFRGLYKILKFSFKEMQTELNVLGKVQYCLFIEMYLNYNIVQTRVPK